MKKKIICLGLVAAMLASLAACNKNAGNNDTVTPTEGTTGALSYTLEDYKNYVVLGDYENLEVSVDRSVLEVTDDEIQEQIDMTLEQYASENHITEGTVQVGDEINLDFSGLLDGVAFSGGTATDTNYTVGGAMNEYGQMMKYIDDLDNGLVGLTVGKEYEIPCKFPENYGEETLNGKDVIFVVTVNYIIERVEAEFNDDFVKKVAADMGLTMSTTDDFINEIKSFLSSSKEESFAKAKFDLIYEELLKTTEIKGYPESEYQALKETVRANIEQQFEMYGAYYQAEDVESFYAANIAPYYGYETMEEFLTAYPQEFLKEKMIVTLIAEKEGCQATDEEIKELGDQLATANGYENFDAVIAELGEDVREEIRLSILEEKVVAVLAEKVKEAQ